MADGNADDAYVLPGAEEALAEWHALFARVCNSKKLGVKDVSVTMRQQGVADAPVNAWLQGTDAPRDPGTHDALLRALGLAGSSKDSVIDIHDALVSAHETLLAVGFAQPQAQAEPSPLVRKAQIIDPNRQVHQGHLTPTANPIHERSGMPRLHTQDVAYADLSTSELSRILETTMNPHEMLSAAYGLAMRHGDNPHAKQDGHYAVILNIRQGKTLPSTQMLDIIQQHMQLWKIPAAQQLRFKHICIAARLHEIEYHDTNNKGIGKQLAEMPPIFWRAMLDQALYGDALKHIPEEEHGYAGYWKDAMPTITHQGEYLRAMRYYLDLRLTDIRGKSGFNLMRQLETGTYPHAATSSERHKVMQTTCMFFDQYQSQHPELPRFYDATLMQRLPVTDPSPEVNTGRNRG